MTVITQRCDTSRRMAGNWQWPGAPLVSYRLPDTKRLSVRRILRRDEVHLPPLRNPVIGRG